MDFIFYLSCAFFILLFGTLDSNIDYDFWARIVVGKSYFQTGTLFHNDFLSYGTTHEFIDHEWGSSLIFYLIQENFGDVGLYLFKSLIIFLTIFIITKIIRLENKKTKLYFLFFYVIIQSVSYNIFSTVRCQTFSFLFFVLYLYILKKVKTENNYRILWCLPVLNIIWANLHGGFALGLCLIFLFSVGEFLNKNKYKEYFITFIVSCLTTLINPYGIKYVYFIFNALLLNRVYVTEWQSSFFGPYKYTMLKYKLFFYPAIVIFLYSISRGIYLNGIKNFYKKIDKSKYLIIIFTLLISIKYLRFQVFFSYSVFALCYIDFYNIYSKKLPDIIDNAKEIIFCFLLSVSFVSHICRYKYTNTVNPLVYPVRCVEFLKINNIKGNILSNFHFGSYIAYKLYPNNFIYMDGRYEEVYDVNILNIIADIFTDNNYKKNLTKAHHDIIIVEKFYEIYNILKRDSDWFLAYDDVNFAVYLPSKLKNNNFKQPTTDENYYNKTKFQTNIDWIK